MDDDKDPKKMKLRDRIQGKGIEIKVTSTFNDEPPDGPSLYVYLNEIFSPSILNFLEENGIEMDVIFRLKGVKINLISGL